MTAFAKGKRNGVDRGALPRYPDGSQWWPPGLPHDADDDALAAALRGAWATPRWVLDLALDVRELLGGPEASLGFNLDVCSRPGTPADEVSQYWLDGAQRGDGLSRVGDWSIGARHIARGILPQSMADWLGVKLQPTIWCNFPFSDPSPWVVRAEHAGRDGCWVSVLAPHTTGAWWDDLRTHMIAEVPLRRIEFEACPGLLAPDGKPARGDRPSQQCSLVTLAPAGTRITTPRVLARDVPRLGPQRFVLLPGPGFG